MKKIGLLSLLSFIGLVAFAAFPVETQVLLSEIDPDKFKLDTGAFIIGVLTMPLFIFFGLPLLLLFINKKNFRKSLALGWLAALVLIIVISVGTASDFKFLY